MATQVPQRFSKSELKRYGFDVYVGHHKRDTACRCTSSCAVLKSIISSDGARQYRLYCDECERCLSSPIPHNRLDPLMMEYANRAVVVDYSERLPLLRAWPHQWGSGMIHQIDPERDQTLCGKSPGGCPGTKFDGTVKMITCKSCLRSRETRTRAVEWQEHHAQLKIAREQENRRWWNDYSAYLLSPTWRTKRESVMRRANGICEGCGHRRAAQVHHLRYPRGCWPGSEQWIREEKLFDLRAICFECHDDVHSRKNY
jgi:hypothetical protein